MEYPMSMKHVDTIYKLITSTELRTIIRPDLVNDTQDANLIQK